MSEVQYILKAFRNDKVAAVHEQEVTPLDNQKAIANEIAERFGLGAFVKETIARVYIYEDGEIITYFRLTPLRS